MKISNTQVAYHRNGVAGIGFYVVTFTWKDPDTRKPRHMVATVFPKRGEVAVLDIDETTKDNIAFAKGNSWRGDDFEEALHQAIAEHDEEQNAFYRTLPFHTTTPGDRL